MSRIKPGPEATLNRHNIYVLPTRNCLLFLLAFALIFIAAINYAVSLAFGLAFMLVSLFVLAILHTFNNLNQLQIKRLPSSPVFCGEDAAFNVEISRRKTRVHEALELRIGEGTVTHADLIELDRVSLQVFAQTKQRGLFRPSLLRISTHFPLGLCRAWSLVNLDLQCLVYPKPISFVMDQQTTGTSGEQESALVREGSEEFYGLRDYIPGDSLKQVAWKNVARGQGMQLKQFVDYVDSRVWLDWDMFYGFDEEGRLSRLCDCVLQLSARKTPFGLKLPGTEIAPAVGNGHREKLLRALALYGEPDSESRGHSAHGTARTGKRVGALGK